MIRRREFITLVGGATAWPVTARAQPAGKLARIGGFMVGTNPILATAQQAFIEELRKLGFSEGRNLIVDTKSTEQDLPAMTRQAMEAVRDGADVLIASGQEDTLKAALAASRIMPIVVVAINYDPIALGYVQSLARPGGTITGVFLRQTELAEKQIELLTQAFPERARLAVLWDAGSADLFAAA